MDAEELRQALIAASNRWRQLDSARTEAKKAVFQAAADYMRTDVAASEVAALTPFSDALVRAEVRKLGVDPKRRGPQRQQEPIPRNESPSRNPAPVRQPTFMSAADRNAELLAMASSLGPGRHAELVSLLEKNQWGWFRTLRPGMSDWDIIKAAIEAGRLTTTDLMH